MWSVFSNPPDCNFSFRLSGFLFSCVHLFIYLLYTFQSDITTSSWKMDVLMEIRGKSFIAQLLFFKYSAHPGK
uniref:Uncharacterized protein n=1 Tax=Anguilla anguilla TaxID=7936 RepID=A0A0E9SE57_ANGAN